MNMDEERKKIGSFIKSGLAGLSIVLLVLCGTRCAPDAVETFQTVMDERKLPIYSVDTNEKKVSLSFDADAGDGYTEEILEILDKYSIKATFFMTGSWAAQHPEQVREIAEAGHDLGNHSENHERMSKLTNQQCTEEIMSVHKKVKELTGTDMILFRPPYGDYNNTVMDAVNECGYYCIEWNIDSMDWKDYGKDAIVNEVLKNKNLFNGSIILCNTGAEYTKDALGKMITGLLKKGYQIVPVSELIYKDSYYIDKDGRQILNQEK